MVARAVDIPELVQKARAGRPRAVARLISLVEDRHSCTPEVMATLAPYTGHTRVVGVTGNSGVGKSTLVAALVGALREQDQRVGVLTVDPSSSLGGGALLGDRVRMQMHALDPEVFIRSMATRGQPGGLAPALPQALHVLEAAGYEVVLVETAGTGHDDLGVTSLADSTVVVTVPGVGDGVQLAKAGVMESADVLVLNRADAPGGDEVLRELRNAARASARGADRGADSGADRGADRVWCPPVVRIAAREGHGVEGLVTVLRHHETWLVETGELADRRTLRALREIESLLRGSAARAVPVEPARLRELAVEVAAGRTDPFTAVARLTAAS